MRTSPDIRLGGLADIPAVASVHLESARLAYRGISPDTVLDALTLEGRIELWRRRFDDLGPDGRLWVIQRAGIVGFAAADRVGDVRERSCELLSFYVAPDWWGKKIGHELMQWVLEDLRARHFGRILLWTIQTNHRARDFYEKVGFRCDNVTRTISRRESGVIVEHHEIKYSRSLV
jgi:GNAT superfamily N-acetyltransferase